MRDVRGTPPNRSSIARCDPPLSREGGRGEGGGAVIPAWREQAGRDFTIVGKKCGAQRQNRSGGIISKTDNLDKKEERRTLIGLIA